MVLTSGLSLWVKGSKDCNIVHVTLDKKKEITGTRVVGISLRGSLLPFQLIYKGLTDRCHPSFSFPNDWNITHSQNHRTIAATMIEYANKVLILYLRKDIGRRGRQNSIALPLFDFLKLIKTKHLSRFNPKTKSARFLFPLLLPKNCNSGTSP